MTITVGIHHARTGHPDHTHSVVLSDAAKEHIAHDHDDHPDIAHLKALAGAFITHAEHLRDKHPHAARELAIAVTNAQSAALFGAHGVEKGL